MRARLPVGFTNGLRTGAARSGSMANSSELDNASSSASAGCFCSNSFSGSSWTSFVSTPAESGDGADDPALREQTLHLGVDQSGAELVEIEDARDEDGQADEDHDAPRQAGIEPMPEGQTSAAERRKPRRPRSRIAVRARRARAFRVAASGRCQDLSASAVINLDPPVTL